MVLDNELKQRAANLGQTLREHETIRALLEAQDRLNANTELAALDRHFQKVYQELGARQRAGERLTNAELQAFHTLRKRVQEHALVEARDLALNEAQQFLLNVGFDLSQELGLDYAALVLS